MAGATSLSLSPVAAGVQCMCRHRENGTVLKRKELRYRFYVYIPAPIHAVTVFTHLFFVTEDPTDPQRRVVDKANAAHSPRGYADSCPQRSCLPAVLAPGAPGSTGIDDAGLGASPSENDNDTVCCLGDHGGRGRPGHGSALAHGCDVWRWR